MMKLGIVMVLLGTHNLHFFMDEAKEVESGEIIQSCKEES
jgi:hypothetical protein